MCAVLSNLIYFQAKITEEEEKLKTAKILRTEYRTVWQDITEWVKVAETCLQIEQEGVDYGTVESQLLNHQVLGPSTELCQLLGHYNTAILHPVR